MTAAPTLNARWGIRQVKDGEPTGGGTVGWGWATREEAEAANPWRGGLELEAYDRFGGASMTLGYHGPAGAGTIRCPARVGCVSGDALPHPRRSLASERGFGYTGLRQTHRMEAL